MPTPMGTVFDNGVEPINPFSVSTRCIEPPLPPEQPDGNPCISSNNFLIDPLFLKNVHAPMSTNS